MKTIKKIAIIGVVVLMTSCSTTANFPISEVTPAADITASYEKQGASDYLVTITANNLADSERLNPPKKYYIIWAVSSAGDIKNVGRFDQENARISTYQASFPFKPTEIFITAEDKDDLRKPIGVEISRTKI
ncbi:MAG: hypothetical protein IPO21_09040 [Bacteroidales bacterium]|nr:hypothetical protein [Bacteroidales bacterium]